MAYVIEAFIAKKDVLKAAPLNVKFPIVSLPFDMALMPLDKNLLKSLGIERFLLQNYQEILIDKKLDFIGKSISQSGNRVAFIQARMFAGFRGQACMVWENGDRIRLEVSENAINQAIEDIDDSILSASNIDEFECLNLGRFRYTDEWVEIAEIISPTNS